MKKILINNTAFTLIELIIVISILSILSTISIISYSNVLIDARNSARINDMWNIKVALKNHKLKNNNYPFPWNKISFTNDSQVIIYQWKLNNDVITQELNNKPLDPLIKDYYIYSVVENRQKFQVAMSIEDDLVKNDYSMKAYVGGDYQMIADFIPSIVLAETQTWDINNLSGSFIVNDSILNLPYDDQWKTVKTAQNLAQIIDEEGVSIPTFYGYSSCVDIFENAAYMGTWTYGILQNMETVVHTTCNATNTYIPPTCTSFTYSDRWDCQEDGTQTKTITETTPPICIWGNPESLTTTCTYVPKYTMSNCPAVNSARNSTKKTQSEILSNINDYLWCEVTVSGRNGLIAGYTYSGTVLPWNKMVLMVAKTDQWYIQWRNAHTDIGAIWNLDYNTNTTNITWSQYAWDGLFNTTQIIAQLGTSISYAARSCSDKWTWRYLPATEELNEIYCYNSNDATNDTYYWAGTAHADCVNKGYLAIYKSILPSFIGWIWWYYSSSEANSAVAWNQNFWDGNRSRIASKTNNNPFRCVTRF